MDLFTIKKNRLNVGRAGTGIFLIIKENHLEGKKVLVPANICYAAIYPLIYAGAIPVFCDVDRKNGNITIKEIEKHLHEISAVIIPHMYGNPVVEIERIALLCRKKGVLLIEDCASAMGATVNNTLCGSFGDYSIFSTGYSKTIDLGGGGFVLSNRTLDNMAEEYEKLPAYSSHIEKNDQFFSKLYRLIRNNSEQTLETAIWHGLRNNLKNIYVYCDHRFDLEIDRIEDKIDEMVYLRRRNNATYESHIKNKEYVYSFDKESVPWRFCMVVPQKKRRLLIDYLLEENVAVSDWYPVVTPIFGSDRTEYPKAMELGEKIVNFPLLIEEREIKRICSLINRFFYEGEEK